MKAERMAEKYFRRYGVQTDLGSDSELSLNSDEEEEDEEWMNFKNKEFKKYTLVLLQKHNGR